MIQEGKFGQSIEIIKNDSSFPGKILLVKKGCLAIEFSNDMTDSIKLATGANLIYSLAVDDGIYSFISTVVGFRINAEKTIAVLSPPRAINEEEKRKYFRVEVSTNVDYCLLPHRKYNLSLSEVSLTFYQEFSESKTIDISEGGIKIKTKEEFIKGQYGLLALYIPEKIVVLSRAIRCEPNAERKFDTAFEYCDISYSIRKKISDFLMEKTIGSK